MNMGATTGVVLDPTYTGKAVRGLVSELNKNPSRFKGNQILFIHTGKRFLNIHNGKHVASIMDNPYNILVHSFHTIHTLVKSSLTCIQIGKALVSLSTIIYTGCSKTRL